MTRQNVSTQARSVGRSVQGSAVLIGRIAPGRRIILCGSTSKKRAGSPTGIAGETATGTTHRRDRHRCHPPRPPPPVPPTGLPPLWPFAPLPTLQVYIRRLRSGRCRQFPYGRLSAAHCLVNPTEWPELSGIPERRFTEPRDFVTHPAASLRV